VTDTRAHARLPELDGLRGAAALLVLAFTVGGPAGTGFAADLFFVISGFVLARPFLAFPHPGRALLHSARRVLRLLPLAALGWGLALWLMSRPFRSELSTLTGLPGSDDAGSTPLWWLAAELVAGSVMALAMSALPRRVGEPADRLDRRKFVPVAAVAGGAVALLCTSPATSSVASSATAGAGGLGRAFLGLGLGMLAFVALDRRTSGLEPPLPFTEPAPGFPPGYGAVLATVAFGVCVARPDLVVRTHVIGPALVAAALVWCCAQSADRWPVHRLLLSAPLQWLGARAYALFAVQGVVVALPAPRAPSWAVAAGGLAGALVLAELVTRAAALRPPVDRVRRSREPERRPVTPDLSQLTAAEALSVLTRPTWEGGALSRPLPAGRELPGPRAAQPSAAAQRAATRALAAAKNHPPAETGAPPAGTRTAAESSPVAACESGWPAAMSESAPRLPSPRSPSTGAPTPEPASAGQPPKAPRRALPGLGQLNKDKQPEPKPLIPEPMRPPKTIDLRSIPPELRLRPISKGEPPTDET
jgi:peptidoglycan/LPS O-acetylase OafA/YrhL